MVRKLRMPCDIVRRNRGHTCPGVYSQVKTYARIRAAEYVLPEKDNPMNQENPETVNGEVMTQTSLPIETASEMAAMGPRYIPNNSGEFPAQSLDTDAQTQNQDYQGTENNQQNPVYRSTVDLAGFLRAQSRYIAAQSRFLEDGRSLPPQDYMAAVGTYSREQSRMIRAHTILLQQLGVL